MWKGIVDPGRPQIPTLRTRIACWIPEAKNTHSQYVLLIAFPLQQWLHELDSLLRYTYNARIVITGTDSVYCAVRNQSLNVILINFSL